MTDALPKGYEAGLRSAFAAGMEYGGSMVDYDSVEEILDPIYQGGPFSLETEDAFQWWQRHWSGLGDAQTDGVGAEPSMGDEQTEDESGSETVPRSASEICPCPTPGFTHGIRYHSQVGRNK
jgi:hypothetical protein